MDVMAENLVLIAYIYVWRAGNWWVLREHGLVRLEKMFAEK